MADNLVGAKAGIKYETLVALLFMLKARDQKNKIVKYELKSNQDQKSFGKFDDLIADCEFEDGTKKLICVQLKHTTQDKNINAAALLGKNDTYNLEEYYRSLTGSKIAITSPSSLSGTSSPSSIEYVMFTNVARDDKGVIWKDISDSVAFKSYGLLGTETGKSAIITSIKYTPRKNKKNTETKKILTFTNDQNSDNEERKKFLLNYIFFTDQSNAEDLENKIMALVKKETGIEDYTDTKIIFEKLMDLVNATRNTKQSTPNEDDSKRRKIEEQKSLTREGFDLLLTIAKQHLWYTQQNPEHYVMSQDHKFKRSTFTEIVSELRGSDQNVCVRTEDDSFLQTMMKVYQALSIKEYIFFIVKIKDLREVLLLFEHEEDEKAIIVVDCIEASSNEDMYLEQLSCILDKQEKKKAIYVVKGLFIPSNLRN